MDELPTTIKQIKNYNSTCNNFRYMRLPWGKYKGKTFMEVPDRYIVWGLKKLAQSNVLMPAFVAEFNVRGLTEKDLK